MKPPENPRTADGAIYYRALEDGREIVVYPRIYNSIVVIGRQGAADYESHW